MEIKKAATDIEITTYDKDCCSILHLNECKGLEYQRHLVYGNFSCKLFKTSLDILKKIEAHTAPMRCKECIEKFG